MLIVVLIAIAVIAAIVYIYYRSIELTPERIRRMSPLEFSLIAPEKISKLSTEHIAAISPAQLAYT